MSPIIHWFRRDLRLHDNPSLAAAAHASAGAVIALFVLDVRLLDPAGHWTSAARVRFLLDALRDLDAALCVQGSALIVRRGEPTEELPRLVRDSGAAAVYWNRDYSPFARRRDADVVEALATIGCPTRQFKDAVIYESEELRTRSGTPYTVYTPYARQWRQRLDSEGITVVGVPALHRAVDPLPASLPIPMLDDLGLDTDQLPVAGGEQAGQQQLRTFTDPHHPYAIHTYHTQRNLLGVPATSQLSAHLRFGTVSPRACLQAAFQTAQHHPASADGVFAWVSQLIWRDFYVQILAHFPHVLRGAFKQPYDALAWENNPALFAAWCAGQTGYPIIDAAMRQLNREGWMHNRARMIVASFLTRDLLIDWRWGEAYFMRQLRDGDPAANNGGWQWAAGTGTDAQPWMRIFNPMRQGRTLDAEGLYVRRYVPELATVPTPFLHAPWTMPERVQQACGVWLGRTYPLPIVEHAARRQQALTMYRAIRASRELSEEP